MKKFTTTTQSQPLPTPHDELKNRINQSKRKRKTNKQTNKRKKPRYESAQSRIDNCSPHWNIKIRMDTIEKKREAFHF